MQVFADMARSTLVADVGASITVADGARFPVADQGLAPDGVWFKVVLQRGNDFEVCYVRTHGGDGVFANVLRGQDGTAQQVWAPEDTQVTLAVVASDILSQAQALADEALARAQGDAALAQALANLTPADIGVQTVYLDGPTSLHITQSRAYTITNYNAFSDYLVQVSAGAATMAGDQITFTAPASAGDVTLTVTMDGWPQAFLLHVLPAAVAAPTITSPAAGATGVLDTPTITTSAFQSIGVADAHQDTDWELRDAPGGAGNLVASLYASAGSKTAWVIPAGLLQVSKTYYPRARHRGVALGAGAWGESQFTTAAQFNSYIATPTATPAAFGDPLEGGFYAGMIWGELVQSATSTAIGTGSKTFTVPNMTGAPIVYEGQQLEVRSRANPANKMTGVVTGAFGTQLTINVTSVGGSGTLADWSIMSRYRVIAAPKASGENASVQIKNANTDLPVACRTLNEGMRATQAMRDADSSAVYPAAHWARGLNIGGRTDWYIPARDELELLWRNLKPTTDGNYTSADRNTGASYDYKVNGAYGDTANTHGLNNNSAPPGAAYTSGNPSQTAAAAFKAGGAEAFEYGFAWYWSSSEHSASGAWRQYWHSSYPGNQNSLNKTNAFRVRAVRRSII